MTSWAAAAAAERARRLRGAVAAIALLGFAGLSSAMPAAAVASPDWVDSGGVAARYPAERYVTGYGQARGRDAEVRARQAAMAALAQAVHVHIEFELEDARRSGADGFDQHVAASTRTSSELELQDVRFEIHRDARRVHALAIVERGPAEARRRAMRDRALVRAEACIADAELSRDTGEAEFAERQLERCRRVHAEAMRHAAAVSALSDSGVEPEIDARLDRAVRALELAERRSAGAPTASPGDAADRLAAQLVAQGLLRPRRLDVPAFADAKTSLPSPFGQVMAVEVERALAAGWSNERDPSTDPRRIEIEGTHLESDQDVRVTLIAREFGTGTLVASATASLPRVAIPDGLALRPANWRPALEQRALLEAPPTQSIASSSVSASASSSAAARRTSSAARALRVELWTDRGRDRVSYTEGESIRVFYRVSGPAWLRLVYVLSNGLTVPIEDALHVDADRAHTAIAYPGRLEVVAPFGVEMLHVAAFDRRPAPLSTRRVVVAGEAYDVIDEGVEALVKARGVRVRRGEAIAEDVLTVTTLAAAGGELRPRARR